MRDRGFAEGVWTIQTIYKPGNDISSSGPACDWIGEEKETRLYTFFSNRIIETSSKILDMAGKLDRTAIE